MDLWFSVPLGRLLSQTDVPSVPSAGREAYPAAPLPASKNKQFYVPVSCKVRSQRGPSCSPLNCLITHESELFHSCIGNF